MAAPGDDEGGLAATAILSGPVENPGELMKSLASQVARKRGDLGLTGDDASLQGLDFVYAMPRLAAEGKLRGKSAERWLEDANARAGYSLLLENESAVRSLYGEIMGAQAATGSSARTC